MGAGGASQRLLTHNSTPELWREEWSHAAEDTHGVSARQFFKRSHGHGGLSYFKLLRAAKGSAKPEGLKRFLETYRACVEVCSHTLQRVGVACAEGP